MGTKIQLRRYFILQVQCPSLSKDRKKTYTVLQYGQRVQGEKSEVNCWNGGRITDLSMCKENILYSKSYIVRPVRSTSQVSIFICALNRGQPAMGCTCLCFQLSHHWMNHYIHTYYVITCGCQVANWGVHLCGLFL